MKKVLLWIIGILAVLCIAIWCIWGGEIASIRSIESVDGNEYLYRMEYKAAYDLDDVIANDIDENAELLDYVIGRIGKGIPIKMKSAQVADEEGELATMNCTSFQATKADGEGFWYGRNYDYFKNPYLGRCGRSHRFVSSSIQQRVHNVAAAVLSKLRHIGIIGLAALIQGENSFGLGAVNTAKGQFLHQFIPAFSFCKALLGIFQHLLVRHHALGPCGAAEEEEACQCGHPSLGKYHKTKCYS